MLFTPFSIVYYFLSFIVAQIRPPSQKYFPTAPMTNLSTHSPPSISTTFNYDTPPPSYDEVRNQAGRGSEPSKHVPHHSTGKFDQLKYLLPLSENYLSNNEYNSKLHSNLCRYFRKVCVRNCVLDDWASE